MGYLGTRARFLDVSRIESLRWAQRNSLREGLYAVFMSFRKDVEKVRSRSITFNLGPSLKREGRESSFSVEAGNWHTPCRYHTPPPRSWAKMTPETPDSPGPRAPDTHGWLGFAVSPPLGRRTAGGASGARGPRPPGRGHSRLPAAAPSGVRAVPVGRPAFARTRGSQGDPRGVRLRPGGRRGRARLGGCRRVGAAGAVAFGMLKGVPEGTRLPSGAAGCGCGLSQLWKPRDGG